MPLNSLPLTKSEKFGLLSLVGIGVLIFLVSLILHQEPLTWSKAYEIGLTLLFLCFVWCPRIAPVLFAAALGLSFLGDVTTITLLAMALASAGVTRTHNLKGIIAYGLIYLLGLVGYVVRQPGSAAPEDVVIYGFIAGIFGGLGYILRSSGQSMRELQQALLERERTEQEAVRAERLRIADELHDYVAHDLTIIRMHVSVMQRIRDSQAQRDSLQVIQEATTRALADLRRLVDQTDIAQGPGANVEADIREALAQGVQELESAGLEVTLVTDGLDEQKIPRVVRGTLTRMLREGVTNILKHGAGPVSIELRMCDGGARLSMRNKEPVSAAALFPAFSGGFGTVRMQERARSLNGSFVAESRDGHWVMDVWFPLE